MSDTDVPSPVSPTPLSWRVAIAAGVLLLGFTAYALRQSIGPRGQACVGMFCILGLVAMFSANLRALSWRTLLGGFALQWFLAWFTLKFTIYGLEGFPDGLRPGYECFHAIADAVKKFMDFTSAGSVFVFGQLANPAKMKKVLGPGRGFVFAFAGLPVIIFVSSFFTVMYYLGILQWVVRIFARGMVVLMGTSGAESLTSAANVFMGQTEAPLIIRPFIAKMTQSELFSMMVSGMAHISGALMGVYIGMGADQVSILATCVMAAPGALYLSKLAMPETDVPETRGVVKTDPEVPHQNLIDAAAAGASDGMYLAFNVAAMLIAFLAFLALFDFLLGLVPMGKDGQTLSLKLIFSFLFAPLAFLMGVEGDEIFDVGNLLGTKLALNEFVAYRELQQLVAANQPISRRSQILATFALTGFANFGSIGIQLGGIGAMAPERRPDLARFGLRALYVGFLATILNACIAGILIDD
jgi:CNT family concentrative nucleoside transporter